MKRTCAWIGIGLPSRRLERRARARGGGPAPPPCGFCKGFVKTAIAGRRGASVYWKGAGGIRAPAGKVRRRTCSFRTLTP